MNGFDISPTFKDATDEQVWLAAFVARASSPCIYADDYTRTADLCLREFKARFRSPDKSFKFGTEGES